MSVDELDAALGPEFDFGDWFRLDDDAIGFGWKSAAHPWLLRERTDPSRPRVRATPRSSSWTEGYPHGPHPQGPPHGPCCLNKEGRICTVSTRAVSRRWLDGRHSCQEPNVVALRRLLGQRR